MPDTEYTPPVSTSPELVAAIALTHIADDFSELTHRPRNKWTSAEANSAIIGHLLVGWAIMLNAVAFFYALPQRGMMEPRMPLIGVVLALMALGCGWLVVQSEKMRMPSVVFTMASYAALLVWAWQVSR